MTRENKSPARGSGARVPAPAGNASCPHYTAAPPSRQYLIEAIRDAVDFVSLIEETVGALPRRPGRRPVMVRCPWHDDHNPSLAIYPNHAHCFGCGWHGDVFDWLQKRDGIDFRTALEELAWRAGITLRSVSEEARAAQGHREYEDALIQAARYFARRLWETPRALEYALGRAWPEEAIRAELVGYADGGPLPNLGNRRAQDVAAALNGWAGKVGGALVYAHRWSGRVVYLAGRSIEGKAHYNPPADLAGPRRLYPNALYSSHVSEIVLVEGQACAITLGGWGIPAIALAGSGLTGDGDLAVLKQHVGRDVAIYVVPDSDGRTNVAALAAAAGPLLRIVALPEGVADVNQFAQDGTSSENFRALLNAALTWLDLRIGEAAQAQGVARDQAIEGLFPLLAGLPLVTIARYREQFQKALGIRGRLFDRLLRAAQEMKARDEVMSPADVMDAAETAPSLPQEAESLQKDYGHADRLSRHFLGRFRWATHLGQWMEWNGRVWQPVPEERVTKKASDALRAEYTTQLATAARQDITRLAELLRDACTYARITDALSFLKGWDGILTMPEEWNANPWLLNVANGVLDLRTMQLRPHSPDDLMTNLAPIAYDPQARGEHWREHLDRFLPNANVQRQVQRDLGLALVGATLEETLGIWYGTGANGKTTTARALQMVLGDYAKQAAPNLLVAGKNERHPTEIADLAGSRLVFSVEVDEGKKLAEALVKDLTGGGRKKARFMRQDFFEFEQTFSIILIVNHKPVITGADEGIWRRIRLVPWEYHIPDGERRPQEEVVNELVTDGSAILNWLLDGLRDWQADRHWVAPEVQAATDAYRAEQDVLGDFLSECCEFGPRFTVSVSALYEAYSLWCTGAGEEPVGKTRFGNLLRRRGLGQKRAGHGGPRQWVGIRLIPRRVTNGDKISVSPRESDDFWDEPETLSPFVTTEGEGTKGGAENFKVWGLDRSLALW